MLDNKGFDLWADEYDHAVAASDEDNTYPFTGYGKVLSSVFHTVTEQPGAVILDMGFGTGVLTTALYRIGCTVYGQDFSSRMVELASEKMPEAHLYLKDFSEGLAEPLLKERYDFIIATYSLHHLSDPQKLSLIQSLLPLLAQGGKLLIGDIMFQSRCDLERCRDMAKDEWDEEEIYIVVDELLSSFPHLKFTPLSFCSGVICISKPE